MTGRLEGIWADLRTLARQLRREPGFAIVVLTTLALGIGTATTVFSVVNGVLLRPLPYPEAERIVEVTGGGASSLPNFRDLEARVESFDAMAAFVVPSTAALTGAGRPRQIEVSQVTGRLFELVGLSPTEGRLLGPADVETRRVVLSHELWQRAFGGAPDLVGRTVTLDDEGFEVVGIASSRIGAPFAHDAWIPLQNAPGSGLRGSRTARAIYLYGRLEPGRSLADAEAELTADFATLVREHPDANDGWSVGLATLEAQLTGDDRQPLLLLVAAAALFLLIASVNVANVVVGRLEARRREFAVRAAIGAGRARLFRQAWTETVALCLLGCLAGVALAFGGVELALAVFGSSLSRPDAVAIDGRVLGVGVGSALLAATVVGALWTLVWRWDAPADALRRSADAVVGSGGLLRRGLVWLQIGISVVLVVGLGLLVKSFVRVQAVDVGVRTADVVAVPLGALPASRYEDPDARRALVDDLIRGLEGRPGIRSAAVTNKLPLSGCCSNGPMARADDPEREERFVEGRMVSPGFFEVVGMPVLAGRTWDGEVGPGAPEVVINRTLAERLFGKDEPVGERLAAFGAELTIVGVVGDVREYSPLQAPPPAAYLPTSITGVRTPKVVVRTELDAGAVGEIARDVLDGLDPLVPIGEVRRLDAILIDATRDRRATTALVLVLGALSLVLGGVGVYGVMSNAVHGRVREIGVRLALGASREGILRSTLLRSVALIVPGLALGGAGLLVARSLLDELPLEGLLYEVTPGDGWVHALAVGVFVLLAVLAGAAPARRAARVEPVEALREG